MDDELWKEWPRDPRIMVSNKGNMIRCKKGVWSPAKVCNNNHGYQSVYAGGSTQLVHRLVAETWLDNPNHRSDVNHINGDKDDNRVENLEWVTHSQNMYHAHRTGLIKPKRTKVRCVETGEIYESISECARRIGGEKGSIAHCLSGERSTCRGYHFEYVED